MAFSLRASLQPPNPHYMSQISKPKLIDNAPKSLASSSSYTNQNLSTNAPKNKSLLLSNPLKPITKPIIENDGIHHEHARKLKIFKHILRKVGEDSNEGLMMIDAIQRLGLDFHFQQEIDEILSKQYVKANTYGAYDHHDLQEVSLRFRLLRQEGYNVTSDVFKKLMTKKEKFEMNGSEDIKGLMSMFEASQLSTRGEDVLDEAQEFTTNILNKWLMDHKNYEARVVANTLKYPHHKSLARFVAKNLYLNDYKGENGWIHVLQELANLDFDLVKSLHQNEVAQVSKWWKNLGLAKRLEFARDQPVKWYTWSMACLTDPSLSEQRIDITKPISLIYIIDDIFDVYGTLDELTLFTETIVRWDLAAGENLPEYMKICFKALDDITNEISCKVFKQFGHNPVHSLRKAWIKLCKAFLVEAKWFNLGQVPKAEEYLENGIVSSGVHIVLVHIFYLLGQNITSQNVDLIDNNPSLISSVATILRLWDDLGSAKDENQEGKDGSYIHYYMKEHSECTSEEAINNALSKISNAWKNLNNESLSPNSFSPTFTKASLNVARMVPLMYSYDDHQHLPLLEHYIKSMLLHQRTLLKGVY